MKGTTNRSAPGRAEEPGSAETSPSPRFAVRFESSMSRFAENAVASDRAHFSLLESVSSVVLEQVFIEFELPMPEGSEPFRCETIAATFERRAARRRRSRPHPRKHRHRPTRLPPQQ